MLKNKLFIPVIFGLAFFVFFGAASFVLANHSTGTGTYPFTFSSPSYTCNTYNECYSYCQTTPGSGTGHPAVCEQHWPGSTTTTTGTVPAAPSALTATVTTNGHDAYLTWTDNSTNEARFEIWYKTGTNTSWTYWGQTTAGNMTTYTVYGAPTGTVDFVVRACNSSGCSGDSNIRTVTISGTTTGTVPTAPSGLTSTLQTNGYDVLFAWTDNSTNEARFEIWYKTGTKIGR